ncbi:UDP-N-acetylglucosamine 4,6-dehydratase (inverting) [Candidatus Kaiserbacteria bacterium RIFCSPHIGHO2_02_FULL_49_16]|uniref:UDP-N-acetylglucosamine 4,6-dehydratase (Inverting) n=1 Tax=Candidatus Kaiserbacteria bacterium RIFCSPHIGHO2_02_FULL_49_16 TaxID=1798490 RepID=A0A1F6DGQ6_9BACT|nr:MAG: UDP-N-acetylglucosamine 4,6-dehydratase (inverting) [Candidatus Kaiserbacteria bacterium RIFCSPHIGHO2_02_FULL_49_16]
MSAPHLKGKSILITGGTGTFGRAMVAHLLSFSQAGRVIVFSRDEYKQSEMRREFPDERLRFFLGDIRDTARLHRAFNNIDIIIHAAALKQVPALEYNPTEAVETNIMGTKNVIDAAHDRDVERVLVISSDKAVQPVNLYGATKMCAERLAIAANAYRGSTGKTLISVVRYGNVIGSRGSLIELIEKQRPTGVITLTDKRMTRFWIHTDEIMVLVTEILKIMEGGEIFIPKMESLRIVDVMKALAPKCKVKTTGIRPGEKLNEQLITEHEAQRCHNIGSMYVILPDFRAWASKDSFAKKELFPKDMEYTSNNPKLLLSPEHVKRVLKVKV